MESPPFPLPSPQANAAGPIPVSHHLLLCATPSKALCCPDPAVGAASWDALKRLVRELGLEDPARPGGIVLRSKADCLRICTDGPVLLIWPAGVVYGGVTPERIERILREHLLGGCPIPGWIVRDYSLLESSERRSAHDGPHGRIPGGPNGIDRW
jgi:(2Fe-2S) ferredoxin